MPDVPALAYHAAQLLEKSNDQSRQNTPCAPFQKEASPSHPQELKGEFELLSEEFARATGFPPKPSGAGSVGEEGRRNDRFFALLGGVGVTMMCDRT